MRALVTTSWDDGHVDDLRLAALLDRYDLPATFYIAPRNVEFAAGDLLGDAEIRELSQRFEIGAHTLRHIRLPTLPDAEASSDIRDGRTALEDVIGRPVTSFCYVGGAYEERHVQMVREQGFALARTVERHATDVGERLESPTTMHAYRHWSDLGRIARRERWSVRATMRHYLSWDDLAIAFFEEVRRDGGVFHLWGHSWELRAQGWDRLERVLAHISDRSDVEYVDNASLPVGAAS